MLEAPWISRAEQYGTDYMYEWCYGTADEPEEDEPEEDEYDRDYD